MLRYDRNLCISGKLALTFASNGELMPSLCFDRFLCMSRTNAQHRVHRTERTRYSIVAQIVAQKASECIAGLRPSGLGAGMGQRRTTDKRLAFTCV